MAEQGVLKAGRIWEVGASGITSLERTYLVKLNGGNPLSTNGEKTSFQGVPAINSVHPTFDNFRVHGYKVKEGRGADKNTVEVGVTYGWGAADHLGEEGVEEDGVGFVTDYGWESGADSKELTADAKTGAPVLNSAGDPYDSVPTVSVPMPTFTKSWKCLSKVNGALECECKTNSSAITVDGKECPKHSLLCSVSCKRLFGDPDYNFQYTVQLRFRSNVVKVSGSDSATDIGWDVAIVDAGMREWDDENAKYKRIVHVDEETGKEGVVSTPALLDGNGHALGANAHGSPYAKVWTAYVDTAFPECFCSAPPLNVPLPEN